MRYHILFPIFLPHVVDSELSLDAISTEGKGTVHDTRVVDQDMQRQTLLEELLSSLMRLRHIIQIQLQELELRSGGNGVLGFDFSCGIVDGLLSSFLATTSQEDTSA